MRKLLLLSVAGICASVIVCAQTEDNPLGLGTPQKMGHQIDGMSAEVMPLMIGNRMYFSRATHPQNVGGEGAGMDVWYSDYDPNKEEWSEAKNDMGVINNRQHNAVVGISADGNTLYLLNRYIDDKRMAPGISYSVKSNGEWGQPVNLDVPGLENPGASYGFFMMKDEKTLIISYKGAGSKGQEDLYVSVKDDGLWTTPESLGDNINTSGYETSPFITDDGKVLYFSTNGRGGQGSADIFMSKRVGTKGWTNWTDPVNLGKKVNTPNFDGYFIQPEGSKYYYFVSSGTVSGDDIYRVKEGKEEEKVTPELMVKGIVFDEKTKEPIVSTEITVIDTDLGRDVAKLTTSDKGFYQIKLEKDKSFSFNILTKGYHEHHGTIETPGLEDAATEMTNDIPMEKLEVGTKIELDHLYFIVSTDTLREISLPELDKLTKIMLENPDLKIRIEGHTCNTGSYKANMTLSENRAESIKKILIDKGVKKNRLKAEGFGPKVPLVKNDTEEHRQMNRRVDFVIVE